MALGKISPLLLSLNHLKLLCLRQDYQQVVAKFHRTFRSNKLSLALQATPQVCEAAVFIRPKPVASALTDRWPSRRAPKAWTILFLG